jgi:branched-subunit amino acid ABC-type transport system permease component
MEFLIAQLLNGLVYGVLLFLMAAGLSLIFGLMNVVSLAHGSFFMLGAFVGLSIFRLTGNSGSRSCSHRFPWRRSAS